MADRAGVARRLLVGRAGEMDAVTGVVHRATRGEAGALLIAGEAGVGKTALVDKAGVQVVDSVDVLWAPCLPLTSLAVPFLPLTTALRGWAASRDVPVPVLGGSGEEGPVGFDTWLDEQCRRQPAVLVVDDLQWADQSSLDVLMYVLAGLAGRRLAVVTTVRTGEERDPLRRWLADVRRLPGVSELTLGRLDRVATGEQLAGLLGRPPHQSLIDDVFARSRGNAYLTTLLVRGLSPDAKSLPAGLPADLREAATRAWQGLSEPGRALTRLVAIAGRPQRTDQLDEVAATTGVNGDVVSLLREAVDAGVLHVGADDTYWFVHPLLAEVLRAGLLPEERAMLHAAFADALEPIGEPDGMSVELAVNLADHHHQAGHPQQAYRWALLAADAAGRAGGVAEMLRLLRRALDLWPQAPDPGGTEEELLLRIREAAARAGSFEEELAAVEDLLALVNRDRQPLRAAELLVRRMHLRFLTGRDFFPVADMQEAVRLAAADPHSAEHALAMAELADAELWHNMPTGRARADEAVRLARACRSDRALTYALVAWVMARVMTDETGRFAAGVSAAEEARAAAARTRDFFGFVHATLWAGNCLDTGVSREYVDYSHSSRNEMTRLGAPHAYIAWLGAVEASGLLLLGDWRACADRLRMVLGETPGPIADIDARLVAALLACWQSRPAEARDHLARAEELFAEQSGYLVSFFDAVRAELAVAAGDTERAVAAALGGADQDVTPTLAERLMPLAARAMADDAQTLRDRGANPSPAVARLDDLRRRFPTIVVDTAPEQPMGKLQIRAYQALYDAEVRRGRADPAVATAWQRAAQACAEAELPWDEAYAWWRAAEALAKGRIARDAAAALRLAHELAVDLQAIQLLSEIEALAHSARISLASVDEGPLAEAEALPGLTRREHEVLAHIVAGRTYGEIARELVLSEKTVSVHVSHLLHKTGTANRIALAQLARRVTGADAD